MEKNQKDVYLDGEADNYYMRNKHVFENEEYQCKAMKKYDEYIERNIKNIRNDIKVLEIGCCSGYNLVYLYDKYSFIGKGIEPSKKAVDYGNSFCKKNNKDVELIVGTSDELPFEDESFDIIIVGFCLFWVDRKYLFKSISEIDRVLKTGGVIFMEDFDTKIPYKRYNKHLQNSFTYKMNYSNLFLANPQYYLCEKSTYSHKNYRFDKDVQERVASYIIYKETVDDSYKFD